MTTQPSIPTRFDVSAWDLRRLYNEGGIKKLAREGKYNIRIKYGKPLAVTRRFPAGTRSVNTRYFDKVTGVQVARFHNYEAANGQQVTQFDPKFLLMDNVEYHLPAEGAPEPQPLSNKEINRILNKRGVSAGVTYLRYCGRKAKKTWKEQVRDRLVRFGILETRDWVLVW